MNRRITGLAEGDRLEIIAHESRVRVLVEEFGDNSGRIVIQINDQEELLGRIIVSTDDVEIWQAGKLSGPMIEWAGLGYSDSDLSEIGL